MISKVTDRHLKRAAYVYIRQSTMGQVRHHQESTARQYALREKALELGWHEERIRVLDRDLGMSGAQTSGREDFKTLAADVSMSLVGAVIALEASRLARSSADWYRLIEICALTETVIIDEDGCYDPADFNDALLLGLKGTMSQAELHFIRARLQGGRLNKAKRGALRLPLPIGLCYRDDGGIVLDPDEQVQGAVALLLGTFAKTGTAFAIVRHFARNSLTFPKRVYGGAAAGKLLWGHLGHARVLAVLRNPAYAGAYTFGRHRVTKALMVDGRVATGRKLTPRSSWLVTIQDHHEGYITWEQYLENQEVLAKNRTHGERTVVNGPAREGRALLQGLLLCSICGKRVSVRYSGDGGRYAYYECNGLRRDGRAEGSCLLLGCLAVDEVISKRVLAVLAPAQLDLAIEAVRQLEQRGEDVMTQWRLRIERAEYEVGLAERRYEEVDPSNRLVATTLEKRWEEALRTREELQKQKEEFAGAHHVVVTPEQRSRVLALARDLPRLWNAPSTSARDRKRMLRLLVKDITVENHAGRREAVLHVRWQGGACEDLPVTLPPDRVRTPEELAERVCALAKTVRDAEIAATLNREGLRSARGRLITVAMVRTIRRGHGIHGASWRAAGEANAAEIAERYGVPRSVVDGWVATGLVEARTIEGGRNSWIHVTAEQESILRREAKDPLSVPAPPSSEQRGAE